MLILMAMLQQTHNHLGSYELTNPQPRHFVEIQELCKKVYPFSKPWSLAQLEAHRFYFPDGQLIVVDQKTQKVVGLAFSLIVYWNDYSHQDSWQDFTSGGFFKNHSPRKGHTLYGAEVMVDPELRGQGIGKMLYEGRREIVEKYNLKRIRAGARLRGYSKFKDKYTPEEYVQQVVEKKIYDPTLSFQLNQGFKVIDVAPNYLYNDPESLGYAAVIEWINPKLAQARELEQQKQSAELLFSGQKFVPRTLPKELRRLVRKATLVLGQSIREQEGEKLYRKIENYRQQLKRARKGSSREQLQFLLTELEKESRADRLKIVHAFSLQLEVVNACETAYRTWRQRLKVSEQGQKSKLNLTYVLTAHPTEARSRINIENLNQLAKILLESLYNNFFVNETELTSQIAMLWQYPLAKLKSPSVLDEAEYIYSLIFTPEIFDFILADKPSYELRLRTWVGGDKDGHPGVNAEVMKECLTASRRHLLQIMSSKLETVLNDMLLLDTIKKGRRSEITALRSLQTELQKLSVLINSDGTRLKAWKLKYNYFFRSCSPMIKKHHQIILLNRLLELFPSLVLPIELREDSSLIAEALNDKNATIRQMLTELGKIAGSSDITAYARALVISHCESANDMSNALYLAELAAKTRQLPIIPLFESREALLNSKKILRQWFGDKKNNQYVQRYWGRRFEVMLGYSDSAKQVGSLPSRYLIMKAMDDIEKTLKRLSVTPVFFHGSGGSVARGGGSLKEQISWWSQSAVANPKMTVQGEMIQRLFATREILNSQCVHLTDEANRRKVSKLKPVKSNELEAFVKKVEYHYSALVQNLPLLNKLLAATPYQYLDVLKIGSRPSKRPSGHVNVNSLRAIPWVLCWTQSRILLPTWWGVGSAWKSTSAADREKLRQLYSESPFFSSFVKALGFTLAKVELEVWELYLKRLGDEKLIIKFRDEYSKAVSFVQQISQQKDLIWYKPWLSESIRLRSPHIHILNMAQIIAMQQGDEALLRESLVGIASGMLTTG